MSWVWHQSRSGQTAATGTPPTIQRHHGGCLLHGVDPCGRDYSGEDCSTCCCGGHCFAARWTAPPRPHSTCAAVVLHAAQRCIGIKSNCLPACKGVQAVCREPPMGINGDCKVGVSSYSNCTHTFAFSLPLHSPAVPPIPCPVSRRQCMRI